MTQRPILMMDSMVLAILAGTKTVTRRVGPTWARVQPGDRLWVREAFALPAEDDLYSPSDVGLTGLWYRATQPPIPTAVDHAERGRWRPSIHMPRWACRLLLEVVSVTEQLGRECGRDTAACTSTTGTCKLLPDLDDAEAEREGFPNRIEFARAWLTMHPDHGGTVYRVEFRVEP